MPTDCPHGRPDDLFCPDCPPDRIDASEQLAGAPTARVLRQREGGFVCVERIRADGAFDWFTRHLTRWGAERAARLYRDTGRVKGLRP